MTFAHESKGRWLRLYQVDALTTAKFSGNPAGVVANADTLSAREMQAIAREMNCSNTAFLLHPTSEDHDVWVRYFTPVCEVPISSHATVAAHYVRAREDDFSTPTRVRAKTGAGVLPVDVKPIGSDYEITMPQGAVTFEPPLLDPHRGSLLNALGVAEPDLDPRCPVQIVSTGHSKVLIGLRSADNVNRLKPDPASLRALSTTLCCNSYFAFALTGGSAHDLTYGRVFTPTTGMDEDPATVNANGLLGAYLVEHRLVAPADGHFEFVARQGDVLGRPGSMRVTVGVKDGHPTAVSVSSRAVIVFAAQLAM
jgi:PhzF family phenazine biosynthesis protein